MTTDLARLSTSLGDRYRVERELDAGGMATVYLAEDVRHRRRVALEVANQYRRHIVVTFNWLAELTARVPR